MLRSFATPVMVVLVIVLLVMSVGYWGKLGPAKEAATAPPAEKSNETAQTPPSPEPAKSQQPAKPSEPAPAKEDSNQAVLEARRHIDRSGGAQETSLLTVYYVDGLTNNAMLQPVEVRVPFTKGVVKATAEQVLNQPADLKLFSNAPAGTKVASVNLDAKTGVATVDLSAEAKSLRGSEAVHGLRASLVYSLTSIPNVKAVQLWVGGRPAVLDQISWDRPLSRADLEKNGSYTVAPVVKFAAAR